MQAGCLTPSLDTLGARQTHREEIHLKLVLDIVSIAAKATFSLVLFFEVKYYTTKIRGRLH